MLVNTSQKPSNTLVRNITCEESLVCKVPDITVSIVAEFVKHRGNFVVNIVSSVSRLFEQGHESFQSFGNIEPDIGYCVICQRENYG